MFVVISGTINLSPNYGSQLGGSPIQVTGSKDSNIKFREDDTISCTFDSEDVQGVYVDDDTALCVSPHLNKTGKVLFQLIIQSNIPSEYTYTYEADYNSCKVLFVLNCFFVL